MAEQLEDSATFTTALWCSAHKWRTAAWTKSASLFCNHQGTMHFSWTQGCNFCVVSMPSSFRTKPFWTPRSSPPDGFADTKLSLSVSWKEVEPYTSWNDACARPTRTCAVLHCARSSFFVFAIDPSSSPLQLLAARVHHFSRERKGETGSTITHLLRPLSMAQSNWTWFTNIRTRMNLSNVSITQCSDWQPVSLFLFFFVPCSLMFW